VRGLLASLVALVAAGATAATATADTDSSRSIATTAPAFRQTIGVNAAASWLDTPYGDWTNVLARLREMGATNIRTGAVISTNDGWNRAVWGRLNQAVDVGIRLNLMIDFNCSMGRSIDPCIDAIRTRVPASGVASVEYPNEYDNAKDPAWASKLRDWGRQIYTKMKANPATRGIQVVGPSLVGKTAPSILGDLSAYMDAGNLHPYTGGLSPTPEHMALERLRMAATSGAKPLVATEAGFHTVLTSTGAFAGTDEPTAANYTVRTFLEHFIDGIQRTYIFQLFDHRSDPSNPELNFGLLRNDGTPRKAFYAVKNLMSMVGAQGPSKLAALPYAVQGDTSDLRHFVLQQGDGSHLLVLWRTASVWNRGTKQRIAVDPRRLTVSLPTASSVEVGDPLAGPGFLPTPLAGGSATVSLAGDPLVLRVRSTPGSSANPTASRAGPGAGAAAGSGRSLSTARRDARRPRLTRLRVRRVGRRYVATFRVSEPVTAGARVERRRAGSPRRFRILRRITGKALKGGRRTVRLGRLRPGRHRVVITVRDAAGNDRRVTQGFRVR
jgi:hypothetical protein